MPGTIKKQNNGVKFTTTPRFKAGGEFGVGTPKIVGSGSYPVKDVWALGPKGDDRSFSRNPRFSSNKKATPDHYYTPHYFKSSSKASPSFSKNTRFHRDAPSTP